MEELSDEQLVIEYRKGSEEAFDLLLHRYLKLLYGFVYQFVRNQHDAEEIVQESFLKAWKHLKRFDTTKRFKPWLFRIAKNTSFDYLKKKKTTPFSDLEYDEEESFLDSIVDSTSRADQAFLHRESVAKLEKAFGFLSPPHRTVLFLHYKNEYTFREIADSLGEPLDTVKSRYRRALEKLRHILVGEDQTEDSNRI